MKQQMLEAEVTRLHDALERLVTKTRLLMVGSDHLDMEDMHRTFRHAEATLRLRDVEGMIEYLERDIEKVLAQYGTGVRPSWVSGDVGISQRQLDMYKSEREELKEELGI